MTYFDNEKDIVWWASEEIVIPYISPLDNQFHRYFPDFMICVKTGKGELVRYLIEIKPQSDLKKPTPRQWKRAKTWAVNQAKWEAAQKWCEQRGIIFKVMTDADISSSYKKALPSSNPKLPKISRRTKVPPVTAKKTP